MKFPMHCLILSGKVQACQRLWNAFSLQAGAIIELDDHLVKMSHFVCAGMGSCLTVNTEQCCMLCPSTDSFGYTRPYVRYRRQGTVPQRGTIGDRLLVKVWVLDRVCKTVRALIYRKMNKRGKPNLQDSHAYSIKTRMR
jgi:hypothetical protein